MIPTLKKRVIERFCFTPDEDPFKDHRVLLVTPAGLISGLPFIPHRKPEGDPKKTVFEIAQGVSGEYTKQFEFFCENLPGDDGYFFLHDVEIKDLGAESVKLPCLAVFFDQVIGVTVIKD